MVEGAAGRLAAVVVAVASTEEAVGEVAVVVSIVAEEAVATVLAVIEVAAVAVVAVTVLQEEAEAVAEEEVAGDFLYEPSGGKIS